MDDFHAASRMIRLLCKVRGTKHVAKYLPHEVWQFEPCLTLLLQQTKEREGENNDENNDENNEKKEKRRKLIQSSENWESIYVLFLWLGTLCLVPFDILSMDSSVQFTTFTSQYYLQHNSNISTENNTIGGSSQLAEQIVAISLTYLHDSSPIHDASSQCLAQLITRPDMTKKRLEGLIQQCTVVLSDWKEFMLKCIKEYRELIKDDSDDILPPPPVGKEYRLYVGTLKTLNYIFKRGHREKLWYFVDDLLPLCIELERFASLVLERKLLCKLVQRLGLLLLPPREAKWRYQRGHRTLNIDTATSASNQPESTITSNSVNSVPASTSNSSNSLSEEQNLPDFMFDNLSNDENQGVHEYVEHILHLLLIFLSDKDTVVRWSAAKGIGRITMRLPQSHGNDVTEALLNNFYNNFNVNNNSSGGEDSLWHGGCLALAELARRGLLLPNKLNKVIPLICEASRFDLLKGQYGVGAHVRDASSYVWWAFARAYSPIIMKPFILDISLTLLTVTLFDREINCRRAGSAALQENIGRLGFKNFSNGLNIITIADYFSVSNRNNTYLILAPKIALLDQIYHSNFITHLIQYKLDHWDKEIRILAAKSLARLILLEQKFYDKDDKNQNFKDNYDMLELLLNNCLSDNISLRHGSLLATGYVLRAFSLRGIEIPSKLIEQIENLVPNIEKKRLYRGRGSELIREAVCILIENIALAELKLTVKGSVALVEVINEQIKQPFLNIQLAAQKSLRQFLYVYFGNKLFSHTIPTDRLLNITTNYYLKNLTSQENVAITRGYLLALSALPPRLLFINSNFLPTTSTTSATATSSTPSSSPYSTELIDKVYEMLNIYSNNTKKISGEYDAESCKNAINSIIELTEKLSLLPQFSEKFWILTFNILLRALNDYSIDKRGDTGSWSRIAALKGLERIIYAYNRRKIFYDCYLKSNSIKVNNNEYQGRFLLTRYGIGRINQINQINSEDEKEKEFNVEISFFNQSLGENLSENDVWLTDSNVFQLVLKESNLKSLIFDYYLEKIQNDINLFQLNNYNLLPLTPPYENPFLSPSQREDDSNKIYYSISSLAIQEILKQAAEKLDSVREIAGKVLERLLKVTENDNNQEKLLLNPDQINNKNEKNDIDEDIEENENNTQITDEIQVDNVQIDEEIIDNDENQMDLGNKLQSINLASSYMIFNEKTLNSYNFDIPERSIMVKILNKILLQTHKNNDSTLSQHNYIINWNNSTNFCYNFLTYYLIKTKNSFFYSIFLGLIISIGGLTETISKFSSNNLKISLNFMKKMKFSGYKKLIKKLYFVVNKIFITNKKNDRVILPLLKVLDLFYKNNYLFIDLNTYSSISSSSSLLRYETALDTYKFLIYNNKILLNNLLTELKLCKNIPKIFFLIDTLCHLSTSLIYLVQYCKKINENSFTNENNEDIAEVDENYLILLKDYEEIIQNDIGPLDFLEFTEVKDQNDQDRLKNHPGNIRRESIRQITRLLLHKYPRVRKCKFYLLIIIFIILLLFFIIIDAAEALYLFLLSDSLTSPPNPLTPIDLSSISPSSSTYLHLTLPLIHDGYLSTSEEFYNESLDVLTLTSWDLPEKEILMESRNKMFKFLSFPEEEVISTTVKKEKTTRDELDSYEALVREAGY